MTTSVRPSLRAKSHTAPTAARPPANAASGTVAVPNVAHPAMITPTAPTAAPADTPMMPGSASGLRNTPCRTAPDTASPPPTRAASTMRGQADAPHHRRLLGRDVGADVETGPAGHDAQHVERRDRHRAHRAAHQHDRDERDGRGRRA